MYVHCFNKSSLHPHGVATRLTIKSGNIDEFLLCSSHWEMFLMTLGICLFPDYGFFVVLLVIYRGGN